MKKIFALGIVAVLLSFSLFMANCDLSNCVGGGDCKVQTDSRGEFYNSHACSTDSCQARRLYNTQYPSAYASANCSCD